MAYLLLAALLSLAASGVQAVPPDPDPSPPLEKSITAHTGTALVETVRIDADGNTFFASTGLSPEREAAILGQLGLRPDDIPDGTTWSGESPGQGDGLRSSERTSYFRRDFTQIEMAERWQLDHQPPESGSGSISILGVEASATFARAYKPDGEFEGYNHTDSYGHWQEYRVDPHRGIYTSRDEIGPIAIAVVGKDSISPLAVAIGRQYSLAILYDRAESPKHWTEKILHNRQGEVLGRWRANTPDLHQRSGARAWSSTGSLVAEWDEELYPEGMASLSASAVASPYALIPLAKDGEVWRVVSLTYLRMRSDPYAGCADRLDYTETEFRLWVCVAPQKFGGTEWQYGLITLPRISAEEFATKEARQ